MPSWKIKDMILAIMFVCWGVARIVGCPEELRFSIPTLAPAVLQWVVGGLFLFRGKAECDGDAHALAATAISLLLGGVLVSLLPMSPWPITGVIIFLLGTAFTAFSLSMLGGSFAIFPARRTLKTNGPYRVIRHPAYLGETVMLFGVALAVGSPLGWALMAASVAAFVFRIQGEERVWNTPEFAAYQQLTPWRLIPGIW
jgi:protein-S-isoprenylcysteine O-methyltransferase Ste14